MLHDGQLTSTGLFCLLHGGCDGCYARKSASRGTSGSMVYWDDVVVRNPH